MRHVLTHTQITNHLHQVCLTIGLDDNARTAAATFITNKHETTVADGVVWRQRDRVKNNTGTHTDLMTELKLNVVQDVREQDICAYVDRHAESTVNDTDKTKHKIAQLVAYRVSQREQEQSQLKSTLKELSPKLTAWLQSQTNRVLLLSNGALTLRDHVKKKTITRESMKEALCEYLIETGIERPLEATMTVMRGL